MSPVHLNETSYRSLIRQKTPALVIFQAPWCGYCRKIEAACHRIAEGWTNRLTVATVNIDDHPELARELEIEVVPTFILYRNGLELDSIVAPESQPMIEHFLRRSLGI